MLFWDRVLRGDFPRLEWHPALPPIDRENLAEGSAGLRVELGVGRQRIWCVAADGRRLVQLQADRMVYNVRRGPQPWALQPYRNRVAAFERWWGDLDRFLAGGSGNVVRPTVCELSYVNVIDVPPDASLRDWVWLPFSEARGLHPEPAARWAFSTLLGGSGGAPTHRVQCTLNRMPMRDRRYQLSIVVYGAVSNPDRPGAVRDTLDACHNVCHDWFSRLTTAEARQAWNLDGSEDDDVGA